MATDDETKSATVRVHRDFLNSLLQQFHLFEEMANVERRKVDNLETTIRDLHVRLKGAEADREKLRAEITDRDNRIGALCNDKADLQCRLFKTCEQQIKDVMERNGADVEELKAQVERRDNLIMSLEATRDDLKGALDVINRERDYYRATWLAVRDSAEAERDGACAQQRADLTFRRDELIHKVEDLEEKLRTSEADRDALRSDAARTPYLERRNAELEAGHAALATAYNSLKPKEMKAKTTHLEAVLAKRNETIRTLERDNQKLVVERDALRNERDALKGANEIAGEFNLDLRAKVATLEAERDELAGRLSFVELELKVSRQDAEAHKRAYQVSSQALRDQHAHESSVHSQIDEIRRRVLELEEGEDSTKGAEDTERDELHAKVAILEGAVLPAVEDIRRRVMKLEENADAATAVPLQRRPTVSELEEILKEPDRPVHVRPDGSVFAERVSKNLGESKAKFCPDGRRCYGFCDDEGYCPTK